MTQRRRNGDVDAPRPSRTTTAEVVGWKEWTTATNAPALKEVTIKHIIVAIERVLGYAISWRKHIQVAARMMIDDYYYLGGDGW